MNTKELAALTPHEAAAYWFVRQDSGGMTADDHKALEVWLESAAEHRSAYEQTKSMWSGLEGAADDSELRALRVAALASGPEPNVWPRAAAIAASLVVAIAGIAALTLQVSSTPQSTHESRVESAAPQPTTGQYVTAHNQRSAVTLPDGTLVSMNLGTAFRTDFTAEHRLIHLTKGQAFFEVAKDVKRPFIVTAADRKIQALGTKFDVRLDRNRLEVVLLEGRVSVDRSQSSIVDRIAGRSARVELKPDQRFVAESDAQASITATNALQATSWREGWVVFEDETVEHAVAELNRYSERPLVAADDVRQLRLSGVFRIGQPDRFAAVIQELLPLEVQRGAQGETVLVRKPDER